MIVQFVTSGLRGVPCSRTTHTREDEIDVLGDSSPRARGFVQRRWGCS